MKPLASMLKFRCLYPKSADGMSEYNVQWTEFFGGPKVSMYKQAWAGESSSETRVVFTDIPPLTRYNNYWYENCMFYHNNEIRSIDFDTEYERQIIKEYIITCRKINREFYGLYF